LIIYAQETHLRMASSDSDSEGNLVVDDGNGVDDSVCPVCRGSTYIGETISCEKCEYWFHFECVGVKPDDPWVTNEDVPYFCSNCGGKPKKPKKVATPKARKPKATPKAAKSKVQQMSPKVAHPKVQQMSPKVANPKVQQMSPAAVPKQSPLSSPPIKLKISLGKKKTTSRTIELSPPRHIPNKRRSAATESLLNKIEETEPVLIKSDVSSSPSSLTKKRKRQNSEEEEEKWLDAVESGNLPEVDSELKTIRDPTLMTARQRAMVDRKNNDDYEYDNDDSGHMSLAYISTKKGSKTGSLVDEEENLRLKAIKSAKRKEIELEKREQERIKTVDKLLNKQPSTLKNTLVSQTTSIMNSKRQVPKIVYIHKKEGPSLTFPAGMDIPIIAKKPVVPPVPIKCSIKNCENVKKYNCSKTGKPLCSLICYKQNSLIIATN